MIDHPAADQRPRPHATQRFAMLIVVVSMLAMVAVNRSAHSDSITLDSSVRVPPRTSEVLLGDVADLDGPEAERFATLVVARLSPATDTVQLRVGDVRSLLSTAGAHWGILSLNGHEVTIRPTHPGRATTPQAMQALAIEESAMPRTRRDRASAPPRATTAATLLESVDVRAELARIILNGLHRDADDVQLAFDDTDADFLAQPSGQVQIQVEPLTSLAGDRIDLLVRLWADGRELQRRSITIRPMVRTKVVSAIGPLTRNHKVAEADFAVAESWLSPSDARMQVHPTAVVGQIVESRIKAGDHLMTRHVRREALVERGDRVRVRCMVGNVAIAMEAVARADGAEGHTIPCLRKGERTPFDARVIGRGEVIVDLDDVNRRSTGGRASRSAP